MVGGDRIRQSDSDQRPLLWIHRRLPKLIGVHLSKTLIALDLDPFASVDAEELDRFFQRIDRIGFLPSSR